MDVGSPTLHSLRYTAVPAGGTPIGAVLGAEDGPSDGAVLGSLLGARLVPGVDAALVSTVGAALDATACEAAADGDEGGRYVNVDVGMAVAHALRINATVPLRTARRRLGAI
jgi:hypothetical protein